MLNLLKLAKYTGKNEYENKALDLSRAFHEQVKATPMGHPFLMLALEFMLAESFEIVVVGNQLDEKAKEAISILRKKFLPNKVVMFKKPEDSTALDELSNFTEPLNELNGEPTIYLCKNFMCELPTNDFNEIFCKLGIG